MSDSVVPVSDPSAQTTVAQLSTAINSLEKLTTQRMDGIEQAVRVAHEDLVRVPTDVDKAVGQLRDVVSETFRTHLEKFASVQTQFQERDVRAEQSSKDSKVAVDAALQAAKDAVGKQQDSSDRAIAKSESGFTKQIDQMLILIDTSNKAIYGQIQDLKERLAAASAIVLAAQAQSTGKDTGRSDSLAMLFAVLGTLIGLGGLAIHFIK